MSERYTKEKFKIMVILTEHGIPMTVSQIADELWASGMTTQKIACLLMQLYKEEKVHRLCVNNCNFYFTDNAKVEMCDKTYNRAYSLDYRVYRKLINFIKNWKKSIDERRKVW